MAPCPWLGFADGFGVSLTGGGVFTGAGVAVGRGAFVGAGVLVGVGSFVGRTTTPMTGGRGVAGAGVGARLGADDRLGATLGVGSGVVAGVADGATPDGSGVACGPPDPGAVGVGAAVGGGLVRVGCPGCDVAVVGLGTTAIGGAGLPWNPIPRATVASTRLTRPRASTSRSRCAPVTLVLTPTPRGGCSPEPPPGQGW